MRKTLILCLLFTALEPARAQLKRTDDSPAAKAAPASSTDYLTGCSADQQKIATASIDLAVRLLAKRTADLKEQLAAMEGPPAAQAADKLQAALKKHFSVPQKVGNHKAVVQKLISVYEGMYYHLIDPVRWPKLTCEDDHKKCTAGTYAYTWPVQGAASYLCPDFFSSKSSLVRAGTVIHEMAHRQVPTSSDDFNDKGYYSFAAATPLGMTDSLNNSDSYSNFVVDFAAAGAKKKP